MKRRLFAYVLLISFCGLLPLAALADGSYYYDQGCYTCQHRYCSHCQCTDLGRYRNNCINDKRYCDAFGNIGAR